MKLPYSGRDELLITQRAYGDEESFSDSAPSLYPDILTSHVCARGAVSVRIENQSDS
jgi:hypothetical protein